MRWRRTQSANVEDRRGMSFPGGGAALPIGGLGGIGAIIYLVIALLGRGSGIDVGGALSPFNGVQQAPSGGTSISDAPDPDEKLVSFVNFVVDDVQTSWEQLFADAGRNYEKTDLVLFTDATQTGCGTASAQTGPFYCPADQNVYLDINFFRELRDRFGAPGDFAQAYVIAHEFGHHVQKLLGIEEQVAHSSSNADSIRLELQADCFAGVWGHSAYTRNELQTGDVEEGLAAAAAVGDDRIQKQETGRVDRETWTHGSSAQRTSWFKKGYDSGRPDDCNTFG